MVAVPARPIALPALVGRVVLGEPSSDGFHRSWIMLFPEGTYQHPDYGALKFTAKLLGDIKRGFDQRARGIDIALDANHDQDKATGWLERLELRAGQGETPTGLWGLVRWTPLGLQLLHDQIYRYFSPEFGSWTDPATGQKYAHVLMGGALTNRPFLKDMPAIALAESAVSRKSWASVNKAKLPRACFLIKGDANDKSTWKLPVYEGAGAPDADGNYPQRGALNINGVRAAISAIGGARTGAPMAGVPSGVLNRLRGWLKQYGASGAGQQTSKQNSEGKQRSKHMGKQQATAPVATDVGALVASLSDEELLALLDEAGERDEREQPHKLSSRKPPAPDDADEMDDGSDAEEYAEGAGDESDGDESDDDGFDASADRHGPMTTKSHTHGKYAGHGHSGDGSHDGVPLAKSSKMSEPRESRRGGSSRMLAEVEQANIQMREQLVAMQFREYTREVGDTLDGWERGVRQFSERQANGTRRQAQLSVTPRFAQTYRQFMLSETGVRLSVPQRRAVNHLLELALSESAQVRLDTLGGSFDQERRRTERRTSSQARSSENDASDELQEAAERIALDEKHRALSDLESAEQERIYRLAEREVGYRGSFRR